VSLIGLKYLSQMESYSEYIEGVELQIAIAMNILVVLLLLQVVDTRIHILAILIENGWHEYSLLTGIHLT
jgi:hypothetical protein